VEEFLKVVLNNGGQGIGIAGLVYALYVHFTAKLKERDAQKVVEENHRLEQERALALANAERDKKLAVANVANELHQQRLDIQGEFIERLGHNVDNLTQTVSALTADVRHLLS
jgi:hypothetical protein